MTDGQTPVLTHSAGISIAWTRAMGGLVIVAGASLGLRGGGWQVLAAGIGALAMLRVFCAPRAIRLWWVLLASVPLGSLGTRAGIPWQILPLGLASVSGLLNLARRPEAHRFPGWLRLGATLRPINLASAGIVSVASSTVMWLWFTAPGVIVLAPAAASLPAAVLIAGAFLNATTEELIFRGAGTTGLASAGASAWMAALVSSGAFGLAHWTSGLPSGLSGSALAALFGGAQAVLLLRTTSLLAPIAVHAAVNLTMLAAVR